jgi:C-methyltransferase C-terminal domain/Putative zinc binding domain/Methyltransferase domain
MKNINCMNCGSQSLRRFIDLGHQPNGNHFPAGTEVDHELKFPFAMDVCEKCWQVQLEEFPSMEFMFSNHPYITGVNMPVISHFRSMVDTTIYKYALAKNSLVLDIGANDGTLLSLFARKGMRVLGIDPGSNTGKLCRENGITVLETFFTSESARAIRQLNVKPDLITATAVFYHIPDLHDFIVGLKTVMNDNTVFVTQCVYLKDVLEKYQFDHFYHEHTMIHAISPLKRVFEEHGMKLLDVDYYDVHGGSFVLGVALESSHHSVSPSVEHAVRAEEQAGLNNIETYLRFTKQVEQNRTDLKNLLKDINDQGKTVYALGAPLKGSTLLNYCSIGPDLVKVATEVNQFKIGKLTPGTHIPIVHEETVLKHPDYYLLLSWNFLDFFRQKYASFLKAGGKFIVPNPQVRIVEN